MSNTLATLAPVSAEQVIADYFSSNAPSFKSKSELFDALGHLLKGLSLEQLEVHLMYYLNSSSDIIDLRDVSDLEANAANTYTTETKYQVIS